MTSVARGRESGSDGIGTVGRELSVHAGLIAKWPLPPPAAFWRPALTPRCLVASLRRPAGVSAGRAGGQKVAVPPRRGRRRDCWRDTRKHARINLPSCRPVVPATTLRRPKISVLVMQTPTLPLCALPSEWVAGRLPRGGLFGC